MLPLIERDLHHAALARLGLVPLMLLAQSGLPDTVLSAAALGGSVLALVVDDVVWGRAVALTTRPDVLADEREAWHQVALLGERR